MLTLFVQAADSVHSSPGHHTLLALPNPFVIPGDRFRECYNWYVPHLTHTHTHTHTHLLQLVCATHHTPHICYNWYVAHLTHHTFAATRNVQYPTHHTFAATGM